MSGNDPDVSRFAARALLELWEVEGFSAAMNTAQAMELRLAVAEEMLKESSTWDEELHVREAAFGEQLSALQPTVDVRGEDLSIDLGFLAQVVETSNTLSGLRTRLNESQNTGLTNCQAFSDSTNNSQARTGILAESRTGMLETLEQARELSSCALQHGVGLSEDEDEAVQLQKVKEQLEAVAVQATEAHVALKVDQMSLSGEIDKIKREIDSLQEAITEGPQRNTNTK